MVFVIKKSGFNWRKKYYDIKPLNEFIKKKKVINKNQKLVLVLKKIN